MKKILLQLFLFIIPYVAQSQNILNDNFSTYNLGDLNGQNSWTNNSSNVGGLGSCNGILCSDNKVVTKTMSFANFGGTTQAVKFAPDQDGVGKGFMSITSGSVYFGLLINITAATQISGDLFRVMAGSNYSTAMRIYLKNGNGGFNAGVGKGTGSAVYGANPLNINYNTDHLLVLKYTFNAGNASNDGVTLYVDPDLSLPETSAVTEAFTSGGADVTAGIDRLNFSFNFTTRPTGFAGAVTVSTVYGNSLVLPLNPVQNLKLIKRNAASATILCDIANYEQIGEIVAEQSTDGINFLPESSTKIVLKSAYSHDVSLKNGINYFRLKIIGNDGQWTYSKVVQVQAGAIINTFSVYPTIAENTVTIHITSSRQENCSLAIIDLTGKVILKITCTLQSGENVIPLSVAGLHRGFYIVKAFTNNGNALTGRMIKN